MSFKPKKTSELFVFCMFIITFISCQNDTDKHSISREQCDQKINDIALNVLKASPIPQTVYNDLHSDFGKHYYGAHEVLCAGPGSIIPEVQKIPVSHFQFNIDLQALERAGFSELNLSKAPLSTDTGLAFHYAMIWDSQAHKHYFSYVIASAFKDSQDNWRSKCFSNGRFILLNKSGFISTSNFSSRVQCYHDSIRTVRYYECYDSTSVSDGRLPRVCIYDFESLGNFYDHNAHPSHRGQRLPAAPVTHLNISHGAPVLANGFHGQAPILRWTDAFGTIDITDNYVDTYFYKKALDVGHLCPPDCKYAPPSCP